MTVLVGMEPRCESSQRRSHLSLQAVDNLKMIGKLQFCNLRKDEGGGYLI